MRFLAVLVVSFASMALGAEAPSAAIEQAQQKIQRLKDLVAAGAVAPNQLLDAEQALEDAREGTVLERTLYGKLTVQDLTEEQSQQMLDAAQRRYDRQKAKLARQQKLVDAGVLARMELEPTEQELTERKLTLDLAQSRANLLVQLADIARQEEAALTDSDAAASGSQPMMEHFAGDGVFTLAELKRIEAAYRKKFDRPLPISANGETAVHRALGFDHRGRVDVAVNPDQPEGVWLRKYLSRNDIPYYAFRTAVPGKATGAHIHIGPGSTRLRAAD
jgi:hypothetical protein